MYWEQALSIGAEVGIGIAGFSGLFAAISRRSTDHWSPLAEVSLRVLLAASGMATFASLAPFVLFESGLSSDTIWRIGSVVYGAWWSGIIVVRARQVMAASSVSGAEIAVRHGIAMAAALLLLANALLWGSAWPYVAAVYVQLAIAFLAFLSLLMRPDRSAVDR